MITPATIGNRPAPVLKEIVQGEPLFLGEPLPRLGVNWRPRNRKDTFMDQFAHISPADAQQKLAAGDVPPTLQGMRLHMLDIGAMQAATAAAGLAGHHACTGQPHDSWAWEHA